MLCTLFSSGKPSEPGYPSPKRALSPRGESVPGTPNAMSLRLPQPSVTHAAIVAPAGAWSHSTYFHNATSSFLASATMPMRR
jgi:hypothetical protein